MTTLDYEEALFKVDPVFRKLRNLKEVFIRFNNRYVRNPREAAGGLRAVIQFYRNSNLKIFYKYIADTLEECFDEIVNSFIFVEKYNKDGKYIARLSNGPIESVNSRIKVIKQNGNGYRNFERFKLRVLYSLNDNSSIKI